MYKELCNILFYIVENIILIYMVFLISWIRNNILIYFFHACVTFLNCLCLTPNDPHKHIKSLHTAWHQLPATAGHRGTEKRKWTIPGERKTCYCYKRKGTKNTPRNPFRRLSPPSPPPSCLPHNSISCKNVLRYSWTSSAAQSNVSLRQSFFSYSA